MIHYEIYQVDMSQPTGAKIMFRSLRNIQKDGTSLTLDAYKKVYEGDFEEKKNSNLPVTEQLYVMFNISRPEDFKGHSLSLSDIIIVDGQQYFCDDCGFKAITLDNPEHKKEEDLHTVVARILKNGEMHGEVDIYPNGEISILIEWGNWKHEHGYLRYLMQQNGFTETDENVTEEDGSDCYSAIHTLKKVA